MNKYFMQLGEKRLVLVQVLSHLSLPFFIYFAQFEHYLYSLIVYFFTGCIGMVVIGHRWLGHKSFTPPYWFKAFGLFCGTLGGIGSPLAWAAIHRQHHRYVDKKGDPHSPVISNFFQMQFQTLNTKPNLRYVKDLLKDPLVRFFHRHYWSAQIAYVLSVALILGPFSIFYMYLVPSTLLWGIGASLNYVCHKYGYRNFTSNDQSRNNFFMAFIMWGEGWHNNHHADPNNWTTQHQWFEFDISGHIIKLIDPTKRRKLNAF